MTVGAVGDAPIKVDVVGCAEQPCTILRGGDIEATVDFGAAKNFKNLDAKVRATAFGLTVNYPLPEPDACKSLIYSSCPLEAGDLATYKLALHLDEVIPEASVVVELRVVNPDQPGPDGGEDVVFCFSVQLEVINGLQMEVQY